ncbi:CBASS cGAMP synthase [Paracoccus beibuensis]|uniref:CBASS cGAMP synthase n=1 Tax=Paracoccus beibuensis TaxID=547602 RepID=UPI00223F7F47|nr:CBASS cGAMP synthase [Paracoccus beibuensis]
MADASALFHTPGSGETLYARITPSPAQFAAQKARWNDLRDFLKTRLKEDSGYPISTWLQGSYKFDTQIRPWTAGAEFDIDLGVYFEWRGRDDDGNHEPDGFKKIIQGALEDYSEDGSNDSSGVEKSKERCSRISFRPDFHIDIPSYHLDRAADRRALATETLGWEQSDPKAIYKWFRDRHEDPVDRAQLRRQICYIKMWAALNITEESNRPSSIMLTVLVAEEFGTIDRTPGDGDDRVLEALITSLLARLRIDSTIPNPIDKKEDLSRLSGPAKAGLLSALDEFQQIAERANQAPDIGTSAEIWSEAFLHFFPMPEDVDNEFKDVCEAHKRADEINTALVAYQFDPKIFVRAVSKDNSSYVREGLNHLPQIAKNCSISFTLQNSNELPPGASVRWTVRNRGDEAWTKNDVGHVSYSDHRNQESSAYNGKHAMDVAVYHMGRVIGRRRIYIDVRGGAMPPRQLPPKKNFRPMG